jgi:hypothetical protein
MGQVSPLAQLPQLEREKKIFVGYRYGNTR